MEASVRAAEGRGGGKCRVGCGNSKEVGLDRWIGGRIGGIGLFGLVHGALVEEVRSNFLRYFTSVGRSLAHTNLVALLR